MKVTNAKVAMKGKVEKAARGPKRRSAGVQSSQFSSVGNMADIHCLHAMHTGYGYMDSGVGEGGKFGSARGKHQVSEVASHHQHSVQTNRQSGTM